MHLCQILLCPFGAKNPFFYERYWDQIGRKGSQININNHNSTITTVVTEFLINILSDIFQQNVSLLRNIILYEYSGVSFESNIALNHFLARLDESMNNHIISARATCKIVFLTIFKTEMTTKHSRPSWHSLPACHDLNKIGLKGLSKSHLDIRRWAN